MDVNSSISLFSHIHSITADFLSDKLKERGFPGFASSHGFILFQLSRNEHLTMSEISTRINRDKSTTTVLVRKLEKEGFISSTPDTNDKRSRIVKLTEKGKQFNSITEDISHELMETFYKGFSKEEKEIFFQTLLKIQGNFNSINY